MIDMGETALDEDTFNEYLVEMREHYTADKVRSSAHVPLLLFISFLGKYHLLGK